MSSKGEVGNLHAEATLPHVASSDYAGEHWLATFAVYMLSAPGLPTAQHAGRDTNTIE